MDRRGGDEEEPFVSFYAEAGRTTTLLVSVSSKEGARATLEACAYERLVADLPKVGVLAINVLDENVESTMEELRNTPGVKHVDRDAPVHALPHVREFNDGVWGGGGEDSGLWGPLQVQSAAMVNQANIDGKTPTKVPKVSASCLFVHLLFFTAPRRNLIVL